MRKNQLTLCLLLFAVFLSAQTDLKLGDWKSHLPYHRGKSITQSETTVYYATTWSLFMLDKEELSPQFMSKVEGLSDVSMGKIKYAPSHETLIATYSNSNIDLIKPTRIVNLPFIKEDPNIFGDKQIYNIHLEGDDLAYLACGFGIVELNIDREEFGFTTKMNLKVNDVITYEGSFYAATDEGIYRAPNNGTVNLQDFGNWTFLGEDEGFPADYTTVALETYAGKLFLTINDSLYSYQNSNLTFVHGEENYRSIFLSAEGAHLVYGIGCLPDCKGSVLFFDENLDIQESGNKCVSRTLFAIEDSAGRVWYSDNWDKIRLAESVGGNCSEKQFKSPYTHDAHDIVVFENDVYVATTRPPALSTNGFYVLEDGEWNIYNGLFNGALNGIQAAYRVAVHPENKKVYIGTFAQGMWVRDGDNFSLIDDTSGSLLAQSSEGNGVQVGGLAFDRDNNLWITNFSTPNPIVVLKNDGSWQNNFTIPITTLQDIAIDEAGNKWCRSNQGLVVFNEGDINDPFDDQYRNITTGNSLLPSNRVYCITIDLDGDVWVGTDVGTIVFECGSNVFDPQCRGSKRIVEVDGFNAYLLETESVRAIAVDGGNRKWFGTTNGVFVQSPNGEDLIAFFDRDNSPLFDNLINDIGINQITGEVYIGTASGVISVRGEAIGGGPTHAAAVYAFPNPVRPDYNGPIAIKGLPRDANVKITDIKGQLIYETEALGGQAIWDGKDYNGRKAASGVYLVYSTSKDLLDNPDAQVTKILFMK